MKLHIVGGFLGSGKTTAIASAARLLIAGGQRVGIVTNDQGKYLVDTAFFRALQLPAVEVTGGCFCCDYDDLDTRLKDLEESVRPDVIFAESVGSCADIVATVIHPLLALSARPSSFSVFADSRLLLQRLRGLPLPFSDDVVYVFDQQIEEAGLLVINKADLLPPDALAELDLLAAARWPSMTLCTQNALAEDGVRRWLERIQESAPSNTEALDIDYARYGAGEAELAWLDMRLSVELPDHDARSFIEALADELQQALNRALVPVGHVKLATEDTTPPVKVSFTTVADTEWRGQIPALEAERLTLLVNARAQTPADALDALVTSALESACAQHGATVRVLSADHFHPGFPRPTHRMA